MWNFTKGKTDHFGNAFFELIYDNCYREQQTHRKKHIDALCTNVFYDADFALHV